MIPYYLAVPIILQYGPSCWINSRHYAEKVGSFQVIEDKSGRVDVWQSGELVYQKLENDLWVCGNSEKTFQAAKRLDELARHFTLRKILD